MVGATGLVGRKMLQILNESGLPVEELLPAASDRSAGQEIDFQGRRYTIRTLKQVMEAQPDAALFSAGGSVALEWAPKFAEKGIFVIDNSSAWRMHEGVKLVVPEINGRELADNDKIIANPNCSTIQLVMVLKVLHDRYTLKRVVVSTYQAVTGTGVKAVEQLENERAGKTGEKVYPHPIDKNCLPQCDVFAEDGYTKEELKIINESRKILSLPGLAITSTSVRVPVVGGHSESVNIELGREFEIEDIKTLLADAEGITLADDPSKSLYPMPITAHDKDDVFVGRIRRDFSQSNSLNLWIVSDNLRKGAATNAVQILRKLYEKGIVGKKAVPVI